MRLAVIMAACVAGAALFAARHPAPRDAYEAAGTIVIPVRGQGGAEVASRTLQAAELLRQPSVVSEALGQTMSSSEPVDVIRGLDVRAKPHAGVVGFSVRGATAGTAGNLAEALGRVVVGVIQQGHPGGDGFGQRIVGDFEVDADGWTAAGSEGDVAIVGVVPGGRYGGRALRASCERAAGCGAARVVEGRFPKARLITMTVWVRGRQASRLLVVLGDAIGRDSKAVRAEVGREWRRFVVRWTPDRSESRISLQVVNAGPGRSDAEIDGVMLFTRGDALTERSERKLFANREYAYTTAVRIVGSRTGDTVNWALLGAGVGLLVGLAGIVASMLARRPDSPGGRRDPK